jgi:hypothetical protein
MTLKNNSNIIKSMKSSSSPGYEPFKLKPQGIIPLPKHTEGLSPFPAVSPGHIQGGSGAFSVIRCFPG